MTEKLYLEVEQVEIKQTISPIRFKFSTFKITIKKSNDFYELIYKVLKLLQTI